MAIDTQSSFTGGEISPSLHQRVDVARWHNSLALLKNWFVHSQGGISTRPGTKWVNNASDDHTKKTRLIEFEFNTEQTYVLALGHQQMRIIKDGGLVLETDVVITNIAQFSDALVTAVGHGFTTGDYVFIKDVVGMTEVNNRFFTVTVISPNTFRIGVDSTAYTAYSSAGVVARVYRVTTPWTAEDLSLIKFTQSADVMTLTHPDYGPFDITRNATGSDHFPWPVTAVTFGSTIAAPVISGITQVGTASGSSDKEYEYVVTVTDAQGSESVASALAKSGASIDALSTTWGNRIQWSAITGAVFYNVYKLNSDATGVYGFIGQSDTLEFTDYNLGPDMSVTPPTNNNPFASSNNPYSLTYHQQRMFYGGVPDAVQSLFASRSGVFTNFDLSNPVKSDDSIERTMATQKVNEIRHLVSLDTLLAFTSGGVWRIDGDSDGVITPKTITTNSQNRKGASDIPPIIAGGDVLYVQSLGGRVLDLGYTFDADKYKATDISIMAEHLFFGHTIVDWCYAEEPYNLIWVVRSDGILLSLAYLKDHQVWGWSQHETDGTVESIASIAEGSENIVYMVVKRNIDGGDVRYIERLNERRFTDINDAFCVDCGLTYNGASTTTITNLEHLEGETLVALADGNVVTDLLVTDGAVTLATAAEKVHIGMPYVCDVETLDINFREQSITTRQKRVSNLFAMVRDTRGLLAGEALDSLYPIKERNVIMDYGNIPAYTGRIDFEIDSDWSDNGRIFVRQGDPLPATILSLIPEFET